MKKPQEQTRRTWHTGLQKQLMRSGYKILTDAKSIKCNIPYCYRHVDTTCYLGLASASGAEISDTTQSCFSQIKGRNVLGLHQHTGDGSRCGVRPRSRFPCGEVLAVVVVWQISFSKWHRRLGRRTGRLQGLGTSETAVGEKREGELFQEPLSNTPMVDGCGAELKTSWR